MDTRLRGYDRGHGFMVAWIPAYAGMTDVTGMTEVTGMTDVTGKTEVTGMTDVKGMKRVETRSFVSSP